MVRMSYAVNPVGVAVLGIVGALAAPVAQAQNCAPFTDVLASSGFCGNIQWLVNRGITQGCTATQYCPASFVRRDQMAAFLNRLADKLFPLNCATGQVMKWNGTTWACASDAAGPANAFVQGGNAFGATAVFGTNDAQPVHIEVNNIRVMRYEPNAISPNVIGGSPVNNVTAGVRGATIAGGGVPSNSIDPMFPAGAVNQVTDAYGTIGGGLGNRAGNSVGTATDASYATVAGGYINEAISEGSTVGGGANNIATLSHATVAGGTGNTAFGSASAIAGGNGNLAAGQFSTVAGGSANAATGFGSTVGGGGSNVADDIYSTVAGGVDNRASGYASFAAGGQGNKADGAYSFAAGHRAKATTSGTFMWADSLDVDFVPSVNNFFGARATGGVGFTVAVDAGGASTQFCNFLPGYSGWSCVSDRDVKENFVAANGEEVLARLIAMPLFSWNFKGADPKLRMLGPTSQDFDAAFGLAAAGKMIANGNLHGVALAAIQGLNAKLEAKVAEQARELAELRRTVELLLVRQGLDASHALRR